MQICVFLKKRMKEFFVYVLEFMLTLDEMKKKSFNVHKVRNLRAEHFESYSSFSYCTYTGYRRLYLCDRFFEQKMAEN